jgi:diguanylate cyclase (GGDEF)-like protein
MGRPQPSTTGPADEAQTPPPSVPLSLSTSDSIPYRRLLERRLAHQTALAEFARRALNASAVEPLRAQATMLADQAFGAPTSGELELVLDADEEEIAFAAAVADILRTASSKIEAAAASQHASLHDPLTGLANRSLILDHLHLALARADRRSSLAAVIFLDLDDFKPINDTLGHRAGDDILISIAERLRAAVRPSDTLGRWGGDEFVVVCEDLERVSDAPVIVARLAGVFDRPFTTCGTDLHVSASIGVAVSAGSDDHPAALIHAADSAMYRVKHDLPEGHQRRAAPAFVTAVSKPKLEQLISRLLHLLSDASGDDRPEYHATPQPVPAPPGEEPEQAAGRGQGETPQS